MISTAQRYQGGGRLRISPSGAVVVLMKAPLELWVLGHMRGGEVHRLRNQQTLDLQRTGPQPLLQLYGLRAAN